ncbi:MAG TPA: bacteriohemerythrin [Salinivirgaceae bacterium]|nr:bacteriohemerythrin [Salinivirgaceae bacterium]
MALFEWNQAYSVNIAEFDKHHQILFNLANTLHDAMKNRESEKVIGDILLELNNYVKYHFKEEEKVMIAKGFPGYKQHLQAHNSLTEKVNKLAEFYQKEGIIPSFDTLEMLKSWISTHIMVEDKKYAHFFRTNGLL